MKVEVKENIEKKLNSALRSLYYIQDVKIDDEYMVDAWSIVYEKLKDLGYSLNSERKAENIIKLQDEWQNGTRIHIFIKTCDLISTDDKPNVPYRKSINYLKLLSTCNFENDEVVRTWYVNVV